MSVPTNFPDMLTWLIEAHPRLADEWVGQRTKHRMAAPDLAEWLGIVAPSVLTEYEEWKAAHETSPVEPAPLPDDPGERQALLDEVNALIMAYNECLANVERTLANLRVVREGIDSILSRM